MKRTYINKLNEHIGEEVLISGWVDVRRDHGKLIFIDLRDASGKIQMVVLPNHEEAHNASSAVRLEWVLEISGIVNKRPEKMVNSDDQNGDIELEVTNVVVLSKAEEMPFDLNAELNIDTYLDYLPLTLRNTRRRAIFKVQATIVKAYRDFLTKNGFVEFQAPKLVGEDAEGGAGVFHVDYFNDRSAYLATSPQFYKQIMVGVFEKVFSAGTVFRAEKHSTTRHLNEYTSLDAEMGFIKDHTTIMEMETLLLHEICDVLKKECSEEFKLLNTSLPLLPKDIPVLKLREAQKLISENTGVDCTNEPDLEPQHERWLCDYANKNFDSDFIFITHYPVKKRPVYTYEDENDPGYTKSFDLLFRGVEITTGGQRIHNHDILVERMKGRGFDVEKFSYYLQAFKYGMPPHGGFGMGLERLTAKFLMLDNVKEATLFPRDMNRIDSLLSKKIED